MTIRAKICGLSTSEAVDAAVAGGAGFVGFVFYPPSPRNVSPDKAGVLAARVPGPIYRVGLIVDANDDAIAAILGGCALDMLQLHGHETPARAAEIRKRFDLPVMKAIPVAEAGDPDRARDYETVVDWLLFDAKPPKAPEGERAALPGGNALRFDWTLLAGRQWQRPWMLAGGIDADNVADAVAISGAGTVDVSSGVEDRPGVKNPDRIRHFLETVARL